MWFCIISHTVAGDSYDTFVTVVNGHSFYGICPKSHRKLVLYRCHSAGVWRGPPEFSLYDPMPRRFSDGPFDNIGVVRSILDGSCDKITYVFGVTRSICHVIIIPTFGGLSCRFSGATTSVTSKSFILRPISWTFAIPDDRGKLARFVPSSKWTIYKNTTLSQYPAL